MSTSDVAAKKCGACLSARTLRNSSRDARGQSNGKGTLSAGELAVLVVQNQARRSYLSRLNSNNVGARSPTHPRRGQGQSRRGGETQRQAARPSHHIRRCLPHLFRGGRSAPRRREQNRLVA